MEMVKIDVRSALLGAALGALAGGGLAYVLASHRAADRLDAEVAVLKAHYAARLNVEAKSLIETGRPAVGVVGVDAKPDSGKRARTAYHAVVRSADAPADASGETDAVGSAVENDGRAPGDGVPWPPPDRDDSVPHLISNDEFMDEEPVYQKLTLTWYAGDMTLVDDQEAPIPNTGYILGDVKYTQFGGVSEDDRIMYVRNPRLETDFEVLLHDGGYGEIVLNYGRPQ
jgi:hypothetical protein